MIGIRQCFLIRPLALYLAIMCFLIASLPRQSLAFIISSQTDERVFDRQSDVSTIQRILESKAVSQKLSSLGLTKDEIDKRIDRLTDSELHQFASQLNSIYAGGDSGVGIIIALLLIVVLVLVILNLTGHKVVLK
ncbi:MAG: PA2779 family protein [Deltaproteobacteria bacterium]|nr:PA2779 family protein [Deltaproteobacteria bacterium]